MQVVNLSFSDFMKIPNQFNAFNRKQIMECHISKMLSQHNYKVSEDELKKKSKLTIPPQSKAPRGVYKARKDTIIKTLVPKMKNSRRRLWLELLINASAEDLFEEGL
nr:unnamed protein product [Callosobruchus analis]